MGSILARKKDRLQPTPKFVMVVEQTGTLGASLSTGTSCWLLLWHMMNPDFMPAPLLPNRSDRKTVYTSYSSGFKQWLCAISVRRKIALGYVIILSLTTAGTVLGTLVGDRAQQQAILLQQHAQQEIQLFHQVQLNTLKVVHYAQVVSDSEEPSLAAETSLQASIQNLKQSWRQLIELQAHSDLSSDWHAEILPKFIESYTYIISAYISQLEQLQQQIDDSEQQSRTAFKQAQDKLEDSQQTLLTQRFLEISPQLDRLIANSYREYAAIEAASKQAAILRLQIILLSMMLSLTIATLAAAYISHLIVQPLKSATAIAQRVSEEADFDLQAPVTTTDEVGQLTQALNQLISQVKELLEQQKATQMQLIQAEKMSSLGQMVAGIAHEINNPVNFIHGNLSHANEYTQSLLQLIDLYQQHYPQPPQAIAAELEEIELDFLAADLTKLMQSMRVGTERIREIVLSLRNFSRIDEAEIKNVNLHEGIDSTLIILQHRLKATPDRPEIQVIKEYGDIPLVNCFAGQLNQVFMNILSNAIDALEEYDATRTFEEKKQRPGTIRICTKTLPAKQVMISIADNGAGISQAMQTRLFDPFFTTKRIGKGTGLGLAISYQVIVEKHGGELTVHSSPGEGAEFVIKLPCDLNQQELNQPQADRLPPLQNTLSV